MELTPDTFQKEMNEAVRNYDKFVVCLDKTPDKFLQSLHELMGQAIEAYVGRAQNLRHGIARDRRLTIIISQSETDLPLCGIYFILHSPYPLKPAAKPSGEG